MRDNLPFYSTLLNELVSTCIFVDSGTATIIPGSYSQAKDQLDLRRKTALDQRLNARQELDRACVERDRRAVHASRASARRSACHLDKHDSDGREKIGRAIYSGQDGKAGKLSNQMNKKVERAGQRVAQHTVKKHYEGSLQLDTSPAKRKVLATLPCNSLELGEGRVIDHPTLHVGNIDHIGISGQNGAGKSTLLQKLLLQVNLEAGVVYIPQELSLDQSKQVLSGVKQMDFQQRGRLLSVVARLGSPPERLLEGEEVSPGEVRKLILAKGLLSSPKLIIMDEPTNHLDLHSIEALQTVLKDCHCALVLVSHDLPFLDALSTSKWIFEVEEHESGLLGNTFVRVVR